MRFAYDEAADTYYFCSAGGAVVDGCDGLESCTQARNTQARNDGYRSICVNNE